MYPQNFASISNIPTDSVEEINLIIALNSYYFVQFCSMDNAFFKIILSQSMQVGTKFIAIRFPK
jgi:hypothetical protein